ncbi:MAG: T9SS type A sorting domain-containing protein [Cyclobacteriaceae bacterium]|nr:T9SS type A sorting domain-containing protein [Cyclobacteriaceae bacterium]
MKTRFLLPVLFLISIYTQAQVRTILSKAGKVVGDRGIFSVPNADKAIRVHVDKAKALREAEEEESLGVGLPFKFGKSVIVNHTLSNSGTWFEIDSGRVWKLKIECEEAFSISLIFNKLNLTKGTQLFIYNQDGSMLYGPITTGVITKSGKFKSDIIRGDALILELFEPKKETGKNILHLSKVVYGFRDIFQPTAFGGSSNCQDDVSCNANLNVQSNGVAMIILANMERLCSGSLLNNTCQNFTPNILTAFHCIDLGNDIDDVDPCGDPEFGNGTLTAQEQNNAEEWIFRFQYRRPNCNTGSEPLNFVTFQESTFRAGWFNTDFALVEMEQNPVESAPTSGIRYLGWSRSNVAPTSGAFLGHPQGDVMKISTYNTNAASNANQIVWAICPPFITNTSPANTHWTATINDGALQGGSSGGPLFDQNGDVIGQLHGGQIGCAPTVTHSGRFDVSWNGGGTPQTRLSDWLDPNNTNAMATNTIVIPTITGPSVIVCSGETFTLNNVPAGATVTWLASPGYFQANSGSGTSATLIPADLAIGGPGVVTFTITGCGNSVQVQSNNFLVQGLLPGAIYFTNSENDGMYFCSSSYGNYFEIESGASGTNFEARLLDITGQTVLYTSPITTYQAGTPNLWSYYPSSDGYYVFEVRGTNECGSTSWVGTEVEYVNCSWLFSVYPNPTDNYLDIDMSNGIVTETELYQITLVDYTGTEVLKSSSKNKKQRIDTSHLKNGQYVLRIEYNDEVTLHRIVIDR